MAKPSLAPQQARSRESETKLIKATIDALSQYGLEGTTIPRVAEQAGLTPGAVYRRFPDKNALLERCILRILEDEPKRAEQVFTPEIVAKTKLPVLIEQLVRANLLSLRKSARLIRALRQFVRESDHHSFKRKAMALELRTSDHVMDIMLAYRKQIRHPDPRAALYMAFLMLNATIVELVVNDDDTLEHLQTRIPTDDDSLVRELARMFLSYLGVKV